MLFPSDTGISLSFASGELKGSFEFVLALAGSTMFTLAKSPKDRKADVGFDLSRGVGNQGEPLCTGKNLAAKLRYEFKVFRTQHYTFQEKIRL